MEEGSMQKNVAEIYHIDCYSAPIGSLQMIVDAYSLQLVIEAISKVMCMAEPEDADCEAATHIKWFLVEFGDEEKTGIPSADVLAGIHTSIAHGHAYFDGANYIMCKRHPQVVEYTEVCRCKVDDFTVLCARMRKLFLSWKKIEKYLPKEGKVEEAEEEFGE